MPTRRHVSDEVVADMVAFGIFDEIADAPTEDDVSTERYLVWPDNVKTLNVFLAMETQWDFVAEVDGELTRTRLRYESVESVMKYGEGIPRRDWSKIFNDLRAMERAALSAMAEERNKRREQRQIEAEAKAEKG